MQSSTAVVFRALVMLACLVAIPLAAVVGKSLPEMVRGLVDGRWPWNSASAYGSLGEAPRFEPAAAPEPSGAVSAEQTRPGWQGPQPARATSPAGGVAGPLNSSVIAVGHEIPVGSAPGPVVPAWAAEQISPVGLDGVRQAAEPSQPPGGDANPLPNGRATQAGLTGDQFTRVQDRLRQLGTTYSLLESWGNREQLYRFYCKVAVGGNANYTHYFEATNPDPLRAMAEVLGQVEAWRAARQAEGGTRRADEGRNVYPSGH